MKKERLVQIGLTAVFLVAAAMSLSGTLSTGRADDAGTVAATKAPAATMEPAITAQAALVYTAPPETSPPPTPTVTPTSEIDRSVNPYPVPDVGAVEAGRATRSYYDTVNLSRELQEFIFVQSGEACVDFQLVLAIIIGESSCDPSAISPTNDYGLMQINEMNHAWLAEEYGLTNMLDPYQNVVAGLTILSQAQDAHPDADMHMILMVYNMGPTGAARAWARNIYMTDYTIKVMQIRDALICGEYTP